MKKLFLIGVVGVLLLTGCGSSIGSGADVKCSGKMTEDGVSAEATYYAYLKDGKVSKVDIEMTFDDSKYADQVCQVYELAKTLAPEEAGDMKINCSGKTVTIEGMKDDDFENLTKEQFISKAEAQGLSCK